MAPLLYYINSYDCLVFLPALCDFVSCFMLWRVHEVGINPCGGLYGIVNVVDFMFVNWSFFAKRLRRTDNKLRLNRKYNSLRLVIAARCTPLHLIANLERYFC